MFKIASASGAPLQIPLWTVWSLRRSPDSLVISGFLPSEITASLFQKPSIAFLKHPYRYGDVSECVLLRRIISASCQTHSRQNDFFALHCLLPNSMHVHNNAHKQLCVQ